MTALLLRLLRVPAQPQAPDGSPDSIRIFHAGRNYLRWRIILWAISRVFALVFAILGFSVLARIAEHFPPLWRAITWAVEAFTFGGLVALLPFSYWVQKLNFQQRWYVVTDRSLRIRSGIWSVEEITMTFANIQDIRITSGPLQKYLGLADLKVSSAGGGGGGGEHEGRQRSHSAEFAGVDNAEEIRDLIVERLRLYKDAGLGDPGSHVMQPTIDSAAADLLAAARELRSVIR